MAKTASLPFKGNFNHTQSFGARPSVYAKYGLQGHDGDDWMMPTGTPLFAPVTGKIIKHGTDTDGWGIYVQVWDPSQNLVINITHCSALTAITGASVKRGDKIAYSGNTGFSEAPHVHIAAADTDSSGNRINTNNGFKGWYSILDSGKITLSELPAEGTTTPTSGAVTIMTFDEIYARYYAGWPRVEAEADFQQTYGGNLDTLRIARGESPGGPEEIRPPELEKTYYLIPAFNGLSLNEIAAGISMGRVDILAGFLGVDENTKLIGGQAFNAAGFPTSYFPDSSEWIGFKKLVGLTPVGTPGNYFIKPEWGNMSLREINQQGGDIGRSDVLAGFLGISEYYKIPPFQGFGIQGFPTSYIPNSSEWQGFSKVFWQTAPQQPISPTENPPDPILEVVNTNPPDTGEGLTPIEAPATNDTVPAESIGLILSKLDQILAKLETQPQQEETPAPPAEQATGGVFVSSTPARAAIYLDGAFQYDYTPSNFTYQINPGKHILRLKKTGYKIWEEEIDVAPDLITNIEATLEEIQTPLS